MTRARHHTLDVYGAELHLAVDQSSWRALARRIDKLDRDVPEATGQVSFLQWETAAGRVIPHYVIWIHLDGALGERDLIDTVAHEAYHTAWAILDHAAVHEKGNSEACAYLTGWLTGWIWEGVTDARERANAKTAS